MTMAPDGIDETHDAKRRSWVESATPGSAFPIQNLPYGVGRSRGESVWRCVVAIGDEVLDLSTLASAGELGRDVASLFEPSAECALNDFMAAGRSAWRHVRRGLSKLLAADVENWTVNRSRLSPLLLPVADVELRMPARVGDYSDFFTSYHHAINCGRINRPGQPLSPSFWHMPIGYHGRASTVAISGTSLRRPRVQTPSGEGPPRFQPTAMLDYEGELAFFVGSGNELHQPVPIERIEDHLFGVTILNDWSARDTQPWEKLGSGPLLCKNFLTTISPWVVTMDALAPFRYPHVRPDEAPTLLAYLDGEKNRVNGAIDIWIEVALRTERMRRQDDPPFRLSRATFREQVFTIGQIATHHASNGCKLRPGDILASGTISNEGTNAMGCLLELTKRGREPVCLPNGEQRSFLEDGDEVIMSASCERAGFVPLEFGTCRGLVLPFANAAS
ncbi:fumarylacetoacetase [Bradyrhizobium sp. USDA 4449]